MINAAKSLWSRLRRDESGIVTVEFVLIFPIFFAFFLMTYELGIISLRNVMLERGVDVVVREVRIGKLDKPSDETLRKRICAAAGIIPDCENQLHVELVLQDPRADTWTALRGEVLCINRDEDSRPANQNQHGDKNELVLLRACARIDPVLPISRIGRTKVPSIGKAIEDNANAAAGGSYALIAVSSYVVEPH